MAPVPCEDIETMTKQLSLHGIAIVETFVQNLSKTVKKKENNSIEFCVQMGYFSTTISLLKVHKETSEFNRKKIAEGTFSSIFFECVEKNEQVIKSQKVRAKDRLAYNSRLDSILQEYFFYKIAAALEFRPEMDNIFGYDLICYNDRIEFSMELC